jgi:hypothetical protein
MKDKHNRSVETRLSDIEKSYAETTEMIDNFIKTGIGSRKSLVSIICIELDEIDSFYNFCNNMSNDDEETRTYLDKLLFIRNSLIDKHDSL